MKVYVVTKNYGYDGSETMGVTLDRRVAEEYAKLLKPYGEWEEFEALDQVPEHWTVWYATANVHAVDPSRSGINPAYSEVIWERQDLPDEDHPVSVSGRVDRFSGSVGQYYEFWGPARYGGAIVNWHISASSQDKETAERLCREKYEEVLAERGAENG